MSETTNGAVRNPQTSASTAATGWALLHSPLPPGALKPLAKSVYGVDGLTDVNEGYLIERLHQSGLVWEEHVLGRSYLGAEDREVKARDGGNSYTVRYYMAEVHLALLIDGRRFDGVGAHDNRKLDAAFKGARTVAFKNACKDAGMTVQLYKGGKAMDVFYGDDSGQSGTTAAPPPPSALRNETSETSAPPIHASKAALLELALQVGKDKAWLDEQWEKYSATAIRKRLEKEVEKRKAEEPKQERDPDQLVCPGCGRPADGTDAPRPLVAEDGTETKRWRCLAGPGGCGSTYLADSRPTWADWQKWKAGETEQRPAEAAANA